MFRRISSVLFITIISLCISDFAFGFDENILFKDYAVQHIYCDSLYTNKFIVIDPVTAIKQIDELKKWASDKGDVKLVFAVRLIRDRYLTRESLSGNQAENDLLSEIKELEDKNMLPLQAETMQVLSNYYWDIKRYSESFEYAIMAYNIYIHFSITEFPEKDDCLFSYGSKYYYFGDYSTAKGYFLEEWNTIPVAKIKGVVSMLNSMALSYLHLDMIDSAEYYYKKAYSLAVEQKSNIWPFIINGNLGYIYYLQKKYDASIPLLEADVKRCLEAEPTNAANSLSLLAVINLEKNEKSKALQYVNQAYALLKKTGDWNDYKVRNRILPALAKVYEANGETKLAYCFLDSAMAAKDSVAKQINIMVLAGVQHKIEATKHIQETQKYEQDMKKQKWKTYGIIIGLVVFLIIASLFINSQRLKYINTRQRLEGEKKYAETELNNASKQLEDFTRSISEKNDLIEKFASEMHRMQSGVKNIEDNETLMLLQQSTILSDNQWVSFQVMFEKAHQGFFERMNKKVPGLSPIETRFMLLSKLRLSKKEMASALGVSKDAVQLNLERLRSKLNLPDVNFSLEDFVDSI